MVMYEELKNRFRTLREQYGYSQKYAAEQLCISPQAYSHYETGRRIPDIELFYKLACLYIVSMEYLLTGKPSAAPAVPEPSPLCYDVQNMSAEELHEVRLFMEYLKFRKKGGKTL